MKTNKSIWTGVSGGSPFRPVYFMFLLLFMGACLKLDGPGLDLESPLNGTFDVREFDVDTGAQTDRYDAKISSPDRSSATITHFSYFKTPVTAYVFGNSLTIPKQTLNEDGAVLELSGSGEIDLDKGVTIEYSYSVSGDKDYEVDCIAIKY